MKRTFCSSVLLLAAAFGSPAATQPFFFNNTTFSSPPQTNPVIDARAWVNRASFNLITATGLPYESQNTRFFTNIAAPAGTMVLDPGVRFQRNTNGQRFWMDTWQNNGSITTDHNNLFFGFFINDSRASILQVQATNITSKGPIFSGAHGLIHLEGKKINVSRTALRTGSAVSSSLSFGGFVLFGAGSSNYVNDVGVTDLYWGVGNGDAVDNSRSSAMRLDGVFPRPSFDETRPSSTVHEVIERFTSGSFLFTNFATVPTVFFLSGTNASSYAAAAYLTTVSPTSRVVQVVFYPASTDSNFVTDVRFYDPFNFGGLGRPAVAVVGFHSLELDISTLSLTTNSVFLSDAMATTTNRFLARNVGANTRRPNTYEVTRGMPTAYRAGTPGNATYSPSLLYNAGYSRVFVTNRYAGYSAQVNLLSSSASGGVPYDVTNVPGRIEIIGDEVNLAQTRIRSESAFILKANNLISNELATVDAPLINFDARSVQPALVISNLAPTSVRRFGGGLRAWSASWDNFEAVRTPGSTNITTNTVSFHVMVVESQLISQVPVVVNEFAGRGTNVVIHDQLNIGKSFLIEGNSFHLTGGLTLPVGVNLASNTLLNVRNFTNDGIINILGSEFLGTDRPLSYSNYVNHGTNIAASHEIRTRYFENTADLVANGGVFTLDAVTANLVGSPLVESNSFFTNVFFTFDGGLVTNVFTNVTTLQPAPRIQGVSDVQIYARDLTLSNSIINAGALILSVTNRLSDSGPGGSNEWSVTSGIQMKRRPSTSDLMGTHLRSTVAVLGEADHVWAATNLGAVPAGFSNNLALGKLTLDGGLGSIFQFSGVGANNALYVDYIELLNNATNFTSVLGVATNLTIYFANANVPVNKLNGAAGGRFRWVSDFTGPLSSTNITYLSTGNTYTFNIALVRSQDLDSDGDGIVNADDPEPILVTGSFGVSVALVRNQQELRALLSWRALAYSSNFLEFKAAAADTNWQVLTNFHMGPYTWPVTVVDPVQTNGASRVYRLRVDPGPY